jgi:hypothetical protein
VAAATTNERISDFFIVLFVTLTSGFNLRAESMLNPCQHGKCVANWPHF